MNIVVRFSSLGDIVLTASVTMALKPVLYVTLERYREVAERLPGVVEVICLSDHENIEELAQKIIVKAGKEITGVDLHNSLRSMRLRRKLPGKWSVVKSFSITRYLRTMLKTKPAPSVVSRYALAAGVETVKPRLLLEERAREITILVPGAAHLMKQWPKESYIELGKSIKGPVVVVGSLSEKALCESIAREIGAKSICESGFSKVLDLAPQVKQVISGDSGLAHLFVASGAQGVVIFCSTSYQDGFWENRCTPVSLDLPCSPCSRFGADICPFGDSACLNVPVRMVLEALE